MRIRTADLHITNVSLYQLSYIGESSGGSEAYWNVFQTGAQTYARGIDRLRWNLTFLTC